MIQRIQTLFLLLALALLGMNFWMPIAEILSGDKVYSFISGTIIDTASNETILSLWPYIVLLIIIEIVQVVVVLGYKNRIRQMRILTFNTILLVGFVGLAWYLISSTTNSLGTGALYTFKIAFSFPVVSIILNYLAIRAIAKDEALVRSIDRIR